MTSLDRVLQHTERPYLERARAYPFLKWAGGKRALVPEIARLLPPDFSRYCEPFLGGGAVFFALDSRIRTALLSDVNAELVLTYRAVQTETSALIARLKAHARKHRQSKNHYYRARAQHSHKEPVDAAARFIYLNKTCFNGLYRVNKAGLFNVPKGSYKNPAICDEDNLHAASSVLAKARLRFGDFAKLKGAVGDFIYCDPPYDGAFTSYDAAGFGPDEQRRLRDAVEKWRADGAAVMVSNSDTPLIRQLYRGKRFKLHPVKAPRNINCKSTGRKPAAELIITSY